MLEGIDAAQASGRVISTLAYAGVLAGAAMSAQADAAEFADGVISVSAEYVVDYSAPVAGFSGHGRVLDNLDVWASFDMDRLAGWRDATAFVRALNNSGASPNDDFGTLQGVDNIEVARQRVRLYELWVEAPIGPANVRAGLYDLNSEFYSNESAGLLIAPAFGVGSELAATGANGPSIFPSTALSIRASFDISPRSELKFALINATAGVLGDPDGVDTSFDGGAIVIAEWQWTGDTHVGVGGWSYTDEQEDLRDVDGSGDPVQRDAFGAYLTVERTLWGGDAGVRMATAFLRAGVSDGDTTPFSGGWQAGVLVERVVRGRPNSQFSLGINQGLVSQKFRDNQADFGVQTEHAETALEVTYSDKIGRLTIQPDLQFIHAPAAESARDNAVAGALRVSVSF